MRLRARATAVAPIALCAVAAAPEAVALGGDRVDLFVAQSFTEDDNVFRLPRAVDPQPILGSPTATDTYRTTSFGLDFNVPVSEQRFVGNAARNYYRFDRFTRLDFEGYSLQASWLWDVGNRADGRLGYAEDFVLASLANLQSGLQSSTPNFLKTERTLFNAAYELTPRWQLRGELASLQHFNSAPEYRISNVGIDTVDLRLTYVTAAGNHIGVSIVSDDGHLPNLQNVAGVLVNNSYDEQTMGAVLDWTLTGKSRFSLRAGRVARDYGQLPRRNFDDWVFNGGYEWKPTGKFMLTASAQHDISRNEQVNVGFVLVDGVTLQPAVQLTEKVTLMVNVELSDRRYLGDPALGAPGGAANASERLYTAGLTASYQATPLVKLGFILRHEARDSTLPFGDYEDNFASLEVRVAL
jgi:exopolysaccharide biosynthesis operon protein EpsL